MARASIPLLSHYLRHLTTRYGDAATDHELLQLFVARREEAAFTTLIELHAAMVQLVQTTVRGALLFSLGQLPEGAVSVKAVVRARSALQTILVSKLKFGLAVVLMLGLLSAGAAMTAVYKTTAPENEPEAAATEEPLPAGAVARLGTLRFRHSDSIYHIAIGSDGTSILSAAGKAVYVWDLTTGKERRRFRHESRVGSFVCSGDGKLVASGCLDGTVHVWDAATGQELRSFMAHKDKAPGQGNPFAFLSGFTPDGRQIASWGADGTLRLWDAATGKRIHEFGWFSTVWGNVSLSPDGKTLAGAVQNDQTWELRLWEVATGRELKRRTQPGKRILTTAFSPDGKMLAITVGEMDWQKPSDIQLWDADASRIIHVLKGHKGGANCSFAPDGKTLATWSTWDGGTAWLWDASTGKQIVRIGGDSPVPLNQILFCPDGKSLVSYTQVTNALRFWDRASGKEVRSSGDAITPIDFLSFSPDGRLLATGSSSHWVIRLWDVAARKTIGRLDGGLLRALQFSPDGGRLASGAWTDPQVQIWEVAGGKELQRFPSKESDKRFDLMVWSGDGKVLATWTWGQNERHIRLWNTDRSKQLRELDADGNNIESIAFSPDSKVVAALRMKKRRVTGPAHVLLWEVGTGRLLRTLELPANPSPYLISNSSTRLAFSPDGRTLTAGGQRTGASIYVWELASDRLRLTLKHGEDVACLAFSPDGKLLAAANNYNAYRNYSPGPESLGLKLPLPHVHLWDLVAGKEIQVLKGHQGPISSLAFSPDGKLLATGSYDTTVLLWDATRFKANRPVEVELKPEQLESLWADLGCEDAVKAYRAIRTLASAPKSSLTFFKRQLQPVAPVDAKQVARLLADLDSDQFAVREKAMQQLEKLGDRAATALRKALAHNPPLEVRRRIEQLLENRNGADHIRIVRALETLENIGTAEARDLCAALAEGVADAPLTREARMTLRRITR